MKRSSSKPLPEHSGSATRVPVLHQPLTGEGRQYADDQSHPRPDPRAEDDFSGSEMDEVEFSQPGQERRLSCPGCGNAAGRGAAFALAGPSKARMREFVEGKRKLYLESKGNPYIPDRDCVSLELMSVCSTCHSHSSVVSRICSPLIRDPNSRGIFE